MQADYIHKINYIFFNIGVCVIIMCYQKWYYTGKVKREVSHHSFTDILVEVPDMCITSEGVLWAAATSTGLLQIQFDTKLVSDKKCIVM